MYPYQPLLCGFINGDSFDFVSKLAAKVTFHLASCQKDKKVCRFDILQLRI